MPPVRNGNRKAKSPKVTKPSAKSVEKSSPTESSLPKGGHMTSGEPPEEPAMREIDEITDYDEDTSETNSTTGSGTSDSEDSLDTNTTEMEGKGQDEEEKEKEKKESLKAITLRRSSRLQGKMKISPGGAV